MSKRTRSLTSEEVDDYLRNSFWCIWPDCEERKIRGTLLCHHHVAGCAELVYHLRQMPRVEVDARDVEHAAFVQDFKRQVANQPPPPPSPRRTYIYFLRSDDLIKIGYTTRPYERLRQYPPSAEVLCVFPGTRELEKELHGRFRFALRRGREWFRPADEILDYVEAVIAEHGPPAKAFTERHQEPGPRPTVGTRKWRGTKKTAA